jgi:hypothetical protein
MLGGAIVPGSNGNGVSTGEVSLRMHRLRFGRRAGSAHYVVPLIVSEGCHILRAISSARPSGDHLMSGAHRDVNVLAAYSHGKRIPRGRREISAGRS